MPKFPLIGPSYTSQSVNADCQTTMNLYPEQIESGAGNNQIVLYPAPGTEEFVDLTLAPPPPVQNPVFNNTITIPLGGLQSGNDFIGTPFVPGPENILVGDTAFVAFWINFHDGPAIPLSLVMTYLGTPIGTFNQIETCLDFSSGVNHSGLALFYCSVVIPIPGGQPIGYTAHFDRPIGGMNNFRLNWSTWHHLTTFDQSSSGTFTGLTDFAAPPLTTLANEFVLTYCLLSLQGAERATLPFFAWTSLFIGAASAYTIDAGSGLRQFVAAPAGVYTPHWTSIAGAADAGIINAAFHLSP